LLTDKSCLPPDPHIEKVLSYILITTLTLSSLLHLIIDTVTITGVGLLEGTKGVNWMYFLKQMGAWAGTLVVVGGATALLFANAIYTPSALC
jgi:hypothetical protein